MTVQTPPSSPDIRFISLELLRCARIARQALMESSPKTEDPEAFEDVMLAVDLSLQKGDDELDQPPVLEGIANWSEALLELIETTDCNPRDEDHFEAAVRDLSASLLRARKALEVGARPQVLRNRPRSIAAEILDERLRQIEGEAFDPEWDLQYTEGQISRAAACYALGPDAYGQPSMNWPWQTRWWKPADRRRDLVKAAALIMAEIERLDGGRTS